MSQTFSQDVPIEFIHNQPQSLGHTSSMTRYEQEHHFHELNNSLAGQKRLLVPTERRPRMLPTKYCPRETTCSEGDRSMLDFGGNMFEETQHSSFVDHKSPVNPRSGYMPLTGERMMPGRGVTLPTTETMGHLMDVYFQYVHPVLPMLHKATIYEQLYRQETLPPYLFYAVLGLASRFSGDPAFRNPQPGAERPPCTIFYEQARSLIKDEYDHSQIATVQSLLLLSIQQLGFCESQKAWLYIGMAIRMAQDLGLNRELTEQEQSQNRRWAEQRKRTWWSCFVVERLVCAGLGRCVHACWCNSG